MSRMSPGRRWGFSLGVSMVLVGLAAAPAARADGLTDVQVLRAGGCGGIVPAVEPLRRSALLDWTAARWASGRSLLEATRSSGYHAKATAGWHVTGPDTALLQLLRRSECRKIANPKLHDIGAYHRGEDTWIVLGAADTVTTHAWPTYASPTYTGPTYAASLGATVSAAAALASPALAPQTSPARVTHVSAALAMIALRFVNEVRARGTRCGARYFGPAPPLTLSGTLGDVALGHAIDMAQHNYFEHVDLSGQSPADRVRAVGYREKLVGENIAYGPVTVDEVMRGWLASPGHCENIMDPRFLEMGLGYSAGGDRRGPYWDQLFAAPRD